MSKRLSTLILAAVLAAGTSFTSAAPSADQPANPPPPDAAGPPGDGARPRRPGGFHLLPPRAAERLNFTADQQKQLADLETEVKAKLDKILTAEQKEQLEQMRPPPPPPPPPPPDGNAPDNAGPDRPQRPAPPPAQQDGDATKAPPGALKDEDPSHRAVTFTGGYETDPVDHGRPVVLIAAALKVPSEVFRKAFSNVKPAGPGQEPEPAQVRLNKQTLMRSLGPYGITDERLNEVSNYYRYSSSKGEMWRNTPATAYATVRDGVVTGFTMTNPGSGYSSPPKISVAGMPDVAATATLSFGTDFKTNGSIKEITLVGGKPATP
jgi:hypothetical protein